VSAPRRNVGNFFPVPVSAVRLSNQEPPRLRVISTRPINYIDKKKLIQKRVFRPRSHLHPKNGPRVNRDRRERSAASGVCSGVGPLAKKMAKSHVLALFPARINESEICPININKSERVIIFLFI
jgi:hypothetical protein